MAREHRSARLQTRDARRKLTPRRAPYWYEIERGRAIGYYKGSTVGSWCVREYIDGTYRWRALARADDKNDADGLRILSFGDVVRLVLREGNQDHDADPARRAVRFDVTVEEALEDYLEARKVRCSSADLARDRIVVEALVVPTLGNRSRAKLLPEDRHRLQHSLRGKLVGHLTTADLKRWRDSRVSQTDDRELRRRSRSAPDTISASTCAFRRMETCSHGNSRRRDGSCTSKLRGSL